MIYRAFTKTYCIPHCARVSEAGHLAELAADLGIIALKGFCVFDLFAAGGANGLRAAARSEVGVIQPKMFLGLHGLHGFSLAVKDRSNVEQDLRLEPA